VAAALLAAADGRPEAADAALAGAVSTFRAHALPWEEAEALRLWGRHADAADRYRGRPPRRPSADPLR
jgi:hypothetical protein